MSLTNMIQAVSDAEDSLYEARSNLSDSIEPILQAMDAGSIKHDTIVSVYRYHDSYEIRTEWSARSCINYSEYRIPISIIEADDPIEAAKKWKDAEDLKKKKQDREAAVAEIARLQAKLNQSGE